MELGSIFKTHEEALNLRMQRAEILSSNLANADTPGYRAKDFDFNAVLAAVESGKLPLLKGKQRAHYAEEGWSPTFDLHYRVPLMPSLDGNTVDTHLENSKFSENSVRYLTSLRFLDMKIKNALIAIKGE